MHQSGDNYRHSPRSCAERGVGGDTIMRDVRLQFACVLYLVNLLQSALAAPTRVPTIHRRMRVAGNAMGELERCGEGVGGGR